MRNSKATTSQMSTLGDESSCPARIVVLLECLDMPEVPSKFPSWCISHIMLVHGGVYSQGIECIYTNQRVLDGLSNGTLGLKNTPDPGFQQIYPHNLCQRP